MNTVFILTDQHNPFFTGCYGLTFPTTGGHP